MTPDQSEPTGISLDQSNHSYEAFASQPFYQAVDRSLLETAPVVSRLTDFATGTGAIVEQLFVLDKIRSPYEIVGIDIDRKGLLLAQKKLREIGSKRWQLGRLDFLEASACEVPIASSSQELVTFCNSIHLMPDQQETLNEAFRILSPGGMLLVNSAYVKGVAYPEGTARMWGMLISGARRDLKSNGVEDIASPVDLMKHTEVDYREMARIAGFKDIETETYTAKMDRDAVRAICDYGDFVIGALPGVNINMGAEALVNAVDPLFDRFKIEFIPRNWMFLRAVKPETFTKAA